MVNSYYPVVADFHNLGHGGSGVIHQSQLSLPSHLKLQYLKHKPVTSDEYLLEVFKCVCQFIDIAVPIVAFTFSHHVIEIQLELEVTISHNAPSPLCKGTPPTPPSFKEESVVQGNSSYVPSVYDVLLKLNAAQLYSSRLIETLKRKSDLTNTIDRWRSLKKYLIDFSLFIDKVLQTYTHDSYTYQEVEELKKIKNRLTKLISRASIDEISKMFENGISVSDCDLVTAALGLDGGVSSAMCEIRQGSCNHQTDQYHIRDIVCKAVEDNHHKFDAVTEVINILVASGFCNARASILAENLQQDELSSLQPLTYWVEWYLDYMFEYDIFLNSEYASFPLNADKVNEWSVVRATRHDESADEVDGPSINVQIYNTTNGFDTIARDRVPYPPREVEESVWYHGTDHNSARDILRDGISLKEGKGKQDFSHNDGFYLTPHLDFAKKWAMKKGGPNGGAVIVFKHKINATVYKGLDLCLEESVDKWRRVVKYYRCGQKSHLHTCPRGLIKELKNTDYIEGPMSGDQRKCISADWQPTKKKGDSNQLCIKSQELANEFSAGIDAVIFQSVNNNYQK